MSSKLAVLLIALCAACAPSATQPFDDESWIPVADRFVPASQLWPPEEFMGNNASVVIFTDREGIEQACGPPPEGMVRLACQGTTADGVSMIAVANPCLFPRNEFFAGIMCHELSHANGFKHD